MPVLQVLTKAALLAYERLHVAQYIVDAEWNPEGSPYTSKLVAAWCFDVINSREPRPPFADLSYQIPVGQGEAPSDLLRKTCQYTPFRSSTVQSPHVCCKIHQCKILKVDYITPQPALVPSNAKCL